MAVIVDDAESVRGHAARLIEKADRAEQSAASTVIAPAKRAHALKNARHLRDSAAMLLRYADLLALWNVVDEEPPP